MHEVHTGREDCVFADDLATRVVTITRHDVGKQDGGVKLIDIYDLDYRNRGAATIRDSNSLMTSGDFCITLRYSGKTMLNRGLSSYP